jgi:putative sigma-54 modulation protein
VKVVIHDRTGTLPDDLPEYAERKLSRLSRHFDRVLEAEVEFRDERRRAQAPLRYVEIIVRMDGRKAPLLTAREGSEEPRAALDRALDKVDRQVLKLKERIKTRKPRTQPVLAAAAAGVRRAAGQAEPERLRVYLRPESLHDAAGALRADGHLFRVFLNEDSGEVNVAYRRADGSVAVIEPVAG